MKFKIPKQSNTGQALNNLFDRVKEADKAAREFIKRWGANDTGHYIQPRENIGGGVAAIGMDKKPDGWIQMKHHKGIYYPQSNLKKNKPFLEEADALPQVKTEELLNILGYEPFFGDHKYYSSPGFDSNDDVYLLDVQNEVPFKPKEDMIEIVESEWLKLKSEKKPKKKKHGDQ